MNQRIFTILMLMIIVAGCSKQSIVMHDFSAAPRIHCSQIENIENISNYIIYLNKGDEIPLMMTLDSEVIEINNEQISVILKRKIYFRLKMPEGIYSESIKKMSDENKQKFFRSFMIYLSLDAKSWAPYTDIKAVKKVFGIQGGAVSFGMGITKEHGLNTYLNAKTTKM